MKKAIFIIVFLFAIIFMRVSSYAYANSDNIFIDTKYKSIDIVTAYDIAMGEAKNWNSEAKTYYASSTDCNYTDLDQGKDGTRRAWIFVFVKENPDTCFNVFIKDGEIDHTQEVISAFNKDLILPDTELKTNSKEAVEIAKGKGLQPCENWAIGYHFA